MHFLHLYAFVSPLCTPRDADKNKCYYVGQDDPIVELSGFYGPNVWPDVPVQDFRRPVSEYYQLTRELGRTIWEVLLQGLGYSPSLVDKFAQRPVAPMKMCRYPPACSTLPEQHGAGPHTDFAGLSILLQEPGKHGLEVLHNGQWMPIPAQEDVIVVIVGDMAQRWTEGRIRVCGTELSTTPVDYDTHVPRFGKVMSLQQIL